MDRLDFHTRVLGKKASRRLRNLYGEFLTIRSKLPKDRELDIYLDGKRLGRALAMTNVSLGSTMEKIGLSNLLDLSSARLGGFETVGEQENALRRAGYRFKPLEQYKVYPIFFVGYWGK